MPEETVNGKIGHGVQSQELLATENLHLSAVVQLWAVLGVCPGMGLAGPMAFLENATSALRHHEIPGLAPSPEISKGCTPQGAACEKKAVLQEVLLGPMTDAHHSGELLPQASTPCTFLS